MASNEGHIEISPPQEAAQDNSQLDKVSNAAEGGSSHTSLSKSSPTPELVQKEGASSQAPKSSPQESQAATDQAQSEQNDKETSPHEETSSNSDTAHSSTHPSPANQEDLPSSISNRSNRPPPPLPPRNNIDQDVGSPRNPPPSLSGSQPPSQQRRVGIQQNVQHPHRQRGSRRNHSAPANYEEVEPLVGSRLQQNTAYNATNFSRADDEMYSEPIQRRIPLQRRSRGRRHASNSREGRGASNYEPIVENQRLNKRFTVNMKRYIFTCLGMPGIPGMSQRPQKCCTGFGVITYILLFSLAIVSGALCVEGIYEEKYSEREDNNTTIYIACMLCASYFIFAAFYWILVFWWSQVTERQPKTITFSFLTSLWIFLCLYFIGSTSALFSEIFHGRNRFIKNVINAGPANAYEVVPLITMLVMIIVWATYVSIFTLNVIYTLLSS